MNDVLKKLSNRLIEISYNHKLSHLGSCLTTLPIIYNIYKNKKEEDIFILSNGHSGLALYVVLEEMMGLDAEELFNKHGVHPSYDPENGIHCSTGSLGLGITIAVGYAMADRSKQVHCLISDGESFEGSVWESLNFVTNKDIDNLNIYVNANGLSAYDEVDVDRLERQLLSFDSGVQVFRMNLDRYPFLKEKGMEAHYYVLRSEEERNLLLK